MNYCVTWTDREKNYVVKVTRHYFVSGPDAARALVFSRADAVRVASWLSSFWLNDAIDNKTRATIEATTRAVSCDLATTKNPCHKPALIFKRPMKPSQSKPALIFKR